MQKSDYDDGPEMITVIMGIYNNADTLGEALDSLLNQTYQGFKVVMCDDGSTDDSFNIANSYCRRHPDKFKLLRNDCNLKLGATLNKCLAEVNTPYTARMDGDDISMPNRFERELEFLEHHPEYAFVSTLMIHFDELGDYKWGHGRANPDKEDFRRQNPFCHAPAMVRTEAYRKVGGYSERPETIRQEDYYLWYQLYKVGYRGYNLQEYLYKMRDNREAYRRRSKIKDRINGYTIAVEVAKGLGLKNPYLYPTLNLLKIFAPLIPYRLYSTLRK